MSLVIIEVTGEKKRDKVPKVTTARALWGSAVNNHGGFGRWMFLEIADPRDSKATIRAMLTMAPETAKGNPHAHAT